MVVNVMRIISVDLHVNVQLVIVDNDVKIVMYVKVILAWTEARVNLLLPVILAINAYVLLASQVLNVKHVGIFYICK